MKRVITFFTLDVTMMFIFTTILPANAVSQTGCGSGITCPADWKYPYEVMSKTNCGPTWVECMTNPYANSTADPIKSPFPICARYVTSSSNDPTNRNALDTDGNSVVIYDASVVQQIIDAMVAEWNCVCGVTTPNSQINNCCIDVKWSKNPNDFLADGSDEDITLGRARSWVGHYLTPPCDPSRNCYSDGSKVADRSPYIILNNTDDFVVFNHANGHYERGFFSGTALPTGPNGQSISRDGTFYNLRNVVLHELGHELGMKHTVSKSVQQVCTPPNNPIPSIMSASMGSGEPYTGLTLYDKCYFGKLYCPTFVGLTEAKETEVKSPNRSTSGDVLDYAASAESDMVFTSYTIDGRVFTKIPAKRTIESNWELDISNLANGVYYIEVSSVAGKFHDAFLFVKN